MDVPPALYEGLLYVTSLADNRTAWNNQGGIKVPCSYWNGQGVGSLIERSRFELRVTLVSDSASNSLCASQEAKRSLPCSQQPSTEWYSALLIQSTHTYHISLRFILMLSSNIVVYCRRYCNQSVECISVHFHACYMPAHLSLFTLIISCEKCKLWSSLLCSYLPSLVTSSHFALNKLKCLPTPQLGSASQS